MATEPGYTQDPNLLFLGRTMPQAYFDGIYFTDTFGSEFVMFYQQANPSASPAINEVKLGPFRSNSGQVSPEFMRRQSITDTVEATSVLVSNGGRNFFRVQYNLNSVDIGGDAFAYYLQWGYVDPSTGSFVNNTFPADDEDVQYGVNGKTVTFDNGSVVITSASTRGPIDGLGDFIGNYSTGDSPGNIVSITP